MGAPSNRSAAASGALDARLRWFGLLLLPVALWSGIGPKDRFTWCLEVAPIPLGLAVAWLARRRFPLSGLLLVLLWLHAVILLVGGHYTYAEAPPGEWLRMLTGGARNNYDKLGHWAQGVVPALLTREILLRTSPLGDSHGRPASAWLGFLCGGVALAFSAVYELVEWLAALLTGDAAESFLGTQGYVWDTQTDLAFAFLGATMALLFLARVHDRSLAIVLART